MSKKDRIFLIMQFNLLKECKKNYQQYCCEECFGKILGYVRCLQNNDIIDDITADKIVNIAIKINVYGNALGSK